MHRGGIVPSRVFPSNGVDDDDVDGRWGCRPHALVAAKVNGCSEGRGLPMPAAPRFRVVRVLEPSGTRNRCAAVASCWFQATNGGCLLQASYAGSGPLIPLEGRPDEWGRKDRAFTRRLRGGKRFHRGDDICDGRLRHHVDAGRRGDER